MHMNAILRKPRQTNPSSLISAMDSAMLRTLVEVQSHNSTIHGAVDSHETVRPPTAPAKAVARTYPGAPYRGDGGDSIELQRLPTHGQAPGGAGSRSGSWSGSAPASGAATPPPRTDGGDGDLEMSRPTTPGGAVDAVAVAVATVWHPFMNRFRLLAMCLTNLGNALSDSAAGALIPYMEKHYGIGYGVVSLIFVGQALGFVAAALFLDALRERLGRARLLGLGQAMMTLAYVPLVAAAPFLLIVFAFFFVGFGIAVNVAMGNTFCGGLHNGTLMLGLLHGSYGVGGITGPLIATALVTVARVSWARYYILTLGISLATLALVLWTFWGYEKEEEEERRREHEQQVRRARLDGEGEGGEEQQQQQDEQQQQQREREQHGSSSLLLGMFTALRLRVVLLGAIFIFAYQGAEVSISGWVISFLIHGRGGDPSSVGYVSAGFWAGITLGRFFLSAPAQRLGEKRFVYGLVAGAVAFQVLVWWVPNIVGDAVAVSVVGLLLGPIYPCAAAVFMRGMASRDVLSGMGTISACGSLGGAVAPFVTGLLAQAVGTSVLHPIVIFLFVVMLLCWYGIPLEDKRTE
ncbi:MFS efflux transporter [Purpureocillium lavendulum]|uniref:MFS efflux transporter n=1 Tax=Purpureocillium lavendulum TaxID=1247861 RepID=A0AB34GAN2_9HYPO|nr:MFS efflux transporter [Purpureocillium lavendulum]